MIFLKVCLTIPIVFSFYAVMVKLGPGDKLNWRGIVLIFGAIPAIGAIWSLL